MSETSRIIDGEVSDELDEAIKAAEAVESNSKTAATEVASGNQNTAAEDNPEGGLSFKTLEVGGMITDGHGNSWQVPADNVEDYDDLYAPDPYSDLPKEFKEKFHIIGVHHSQVKDWMQKKYAPVYQREVGISEEMARMSGTTLDSVHSIGDMVLMKIPHVLNDRRQAAKIKETKRRLDTIEPTAEMEKAAQASGIMTRFERRVGRPTLASESPGHQLIGDKEGNY